MTKEAIADIKTEIVMLALGGGNLAIYLSDIQSVFTLATSVISFGIATATGLRMLRKRKNDKK